MYTYNKIGGFVMKAKFIGRMAATFLSVAMLQFTGTDLLTTALAESPTNDEYVDIEKDLVAEENLSLDNLPTDLRTSLEQESCDAMYLDKHTYYDLYSIGTVNSDGTKSLLTFNHPIKYIDNETNDVRFIDNKIIQNDNKGRIEYVNSGNSYDVILPENLNDGISFAYGSYSISMRPAVVSNNAIPTLSENELRYYKVFDDSTDVCYALENTGIKESIIVDAPNGCYVYDFILSAEGLIPNEDKGQAITFVDESTGEPVYIIQPTYIVDSYNGDYIEGEEHITYNNWYEVETQSEGSYLIHMNLDEEFLSSESTVYPCVIDPSVWAVNFVNDSSSYVLQSGGTGYVNSQLSAGGFNGSGEHLSYVKPNSVNTLRWIEPNRLQSATFNVKAASSGYSNSCTINLYDSTTTSAVSAVSYSELISSLGSLQSSATFTTLGVSYSFDVTSLFRQWISYALGEGGRNPAYGFILRSATNSSTPGRWFTSTSSSDTYFYLIYQEGEEIEDGFYNIKNVSTGTYLKYNSGGQLYMSSYPSLNACKWQVILSKSADGGTTYGVYTLRPFDNLNVSMKGTSTGSAVTTNASGNVFRIIRNADGAFRIMPTNYANVSNAIGISSNYATIQEYSNISSMKWTFEPVVNRYFSKYTPDRFNINQVKDRMNCYGYAFGYMLRHDLTSGTYYKQLPGEFETAEDIAANSFQYLIGTNYDDLQDKLLNNMNLDAARFGYTLEEYIPSNITVEQFGANSRLIAVAVGYSKGTNHTITNYHFYMQHNDGTWSHKQGECEVTNYYDIGGIRVYLNNENIQIYAGDITVPNHVNNGYVDGSVKYYKITKDAIADYPHGPKNQSGSLPPTIETETYFKDQAGDCMFTASSISTGTKSAAFDADNDIDFYVLNSSAGSYTLTTSCQNGNDIYCDIYDYNGNVIQTDHSGGQVNTTFSIVGSKNYFIKIYNHSGSAVDYTLTLS